VFSLYMHLISAMIAVIADHRGRAVSGVVCSNPTRKIVVYSLFVLSCIGNGLAAGRSLAKRVLQTVCMFKKL
jgi:hypothetical protein